MLEEYTQQGQNAPFSLAESSLAALAPQVTLLIG